MVEILTLSRLGGSYASTVFPNTAYTNPSVTVKVTKWTWSFRDVELAIDIPETSASTNPTTVAGGFKRITIEANGEGYLDDDPSGEGNAQTKLEKVWNIAEFGDPSNTFGTYRGSTLFGISAVAGTGQTKLYNVQLVEDAVTSEPAEGISGNVSRPKRVKISFTLRKMRRSL